MLRRPHFDERFPTDRALNILGSGGNDNVLMGNVITSLLDVDLGTGNASLIAEASVDGDVDINLGSGTNLMAVTTKWSLKTR